MKALSPVLPQCQIAVPRATPVCPVQAPEHVPVTTIGRDTGLPRPGYSHEQLATLHPPAPLPGLSVASRRGADRPIPPPSRPVGAAILTSSRFASRCHLAPPPFPAARPSVRCHLAPFLAPPYVARAPPSCSTFAPPGAAILPIGGRGSP